MAGVWWVGWALKGNRLPKKIIEVWKEQCLGRRCGACDWSIWLVVACVGDRLETEGARLWNIFRVRLRRHLDSRQETCLRFYSRRESGSDLGFRMITLLASSPTAHSFWPLFSFPAPGTGVSLPSGEFRANDGEFLGTVNSCNTSVQSSHILSIQIYFFILSRRQS